MKLFSNYLSQLKLKAWFVFLLSSVIFFTVCIILVISFVGSRSAIEEKITSSIINTAVLKVASVNNFHDRITANLSVLTASHLIKNYLTDSIASENKDLILSSFTESAKYQHFESITLLSNNFNIIVSTERDSEEGMLDENMIFYAKQSTVKIINSDIYKDGDMYKISFFKSIFKDDIKIGILSIVVDMKPIYKMVQESKGFGKTGETLLGMKTDKGVLFLNPLRHDKTAVLKRVALLGNESAKPILEASQGKSGSGLMKDYRGEEVFASWIYITSFDWGLVTKIDKKEAFIPVYEIRNKSILVGLLIVIIGIFIATRVSNSITKPIINLKNAMAVISKGDILNEKIEKNSTDEIGEMIDEANNLVQFQREVVEFTQEIGKANFNFETSERIQKGDLGKELLNMKINLQQVSEDEEKRNWATLGLAKFAEILRSNNDDLHLLSDDIINNLIKYLGANQGSIFVINDDKKNPKMKLEATYAFDRKKYQQKEIELGEGLVGQCWQEKEKIYLTDIPQNYINITSGVGSANPTSIIIIPLMVNDDIYGIIEMASFHVFEAHQIEFLERVINSIASTLSSVKVNLRTSSLLEEAQLMSEGMQAQEEELRQNAEEMQATQEEMERTNIDLKNKNELMRVKEVEMKVNLEEAQEMSEEMIAQEELLRSTSEEIQNAHNDMLFAQEELTRKEASLRTIIDNSEDSIFSINTNYEITVINNKLLNKYKDSGMDLSEGVNILSLLPDDKKKFWKARYDRALAGEKFEIKEERPPGKHLLVSHYPTLNDKNEITGVAIISREV